MKKIIAITAAFIIFNNPIITEKSDTPPPIAEKGS